MTADPMTFEQFCVYVQETRALYPDWRTGQRLFNLLHEMRPELAAAITGTEADPFYRDALIPRCMEQLGRQW